MADRRTGLYFASLAEAAEDVKRARQTGYVLAGNWSLAQILQHLNLTMRITLYGPPFKLPAPVRPVVKLMFMPVLKRGKPISFRAKAPKAVAPDDSPDEEETVEEFYALVAQLMDTNTPFVEIHPLLGKLDRPQWLLMQKWHAAHHLSFVVPNEP